MPRSKLQWLWQFLFHKPFSAFFQGSRTWRLKWSGILWTSILNSHCWLYHQLFHRRRLQTPKEWQSLDFTLSCRHLARTGKKPARSWWLSLLILLSSMPLRKALLLASTIRLKNSQDVCLVSWFTTRLSSASKELILTINLCWIIFIHHCPKSFRVLFKAHLLLKGSSLMDFIWFVVYST